MLSRLDVATWGEAYAGHLPADLLDGLAASPWHDIGFWQARLADTSRRHWVWLAEAPEPVGYVTFGGNTEPGWPDYPGEIERLYIVQSWRGRGLGSHLWHQAMSQMVTSHLLPIITTVFDFNHAAQRLYERLGGRRLGRQVALEWRGQNYYEYVYGHEGHEHAH